MSKITYRIKATVVVEMDLDEDLQELPFDELCLAVKEKVANRMTIRDVVGAPGGGFIESLDVTDVNA